MASGRYVLAVLLGVALLMGYVKCGERKDTGKCDPRDDCSGHVKGCTDGKKDCMDGWTGEHCTEWADPADTSQCFSGIAGYCLQGGTCFKQACCCPRGRAGSQCGTGEASTLEDEPCTKDCKDQHCERISSDITADYRCDKEDDGGNGDGGNGDGGNGDGGNGDGGNGDGGNGDGGNGDGEAKKCNLYGEYEDGSACDGASLAMVSLPVLLCALLALWA